MQRRQELTQLRVPPVPSMGSGLGQVPMKRSEVVCWGLEERKGEPSRALQSEEELARRGGWQVLPVQKTQLWARGLGRG